MSQERDIAFISQSVTQCISRNRIELFRSLSVINRSEYLLRAGAYYAGRVYSIINELYETTIKSR